jgi:hypothetical protein
VVLPSRLHKRGETVDIKIDSFDFDLLRLTDETGQYVEYNLRDELKVNEANLLQEMLHQPSKFIYWASIFEKLKYFQEAKELEAERIIAQIDTEAREHYKGTETKATKDVVEAYRKQKDEYHNIMTELNYYNFLVGKIGRIVKAFEQRKDMLQSYGKQVLEQKGYGAGAGTRIEDNPFGNMQVPGSR